MQANALRQGLVAHRDACGDVAVATEVFGGRVHHHIGTQFQGTLQIGSAIGVIDHHGDIRLLMGQFGHGGDVDQAQVGVGRGLAVEHAGGRGERCLQGGEVGQVDMPHLDAEFAQAVVQQGERTTIERLADDDLVARAQQSPERRGNRAHAGAERHGGLAVFQAGHA
ncbi:hypothetical protein PFLmoz3_04687 [Pseudomonas fluorescens]|uniref:Uncharacterized protein n=1 Tax=Pseudomonas fluorescens TaxID=294 RepID=A0A109LDU9_PSEFL|nr:hypothetical protein PFLmoz3_04687 [Pseudomonas fluorescens]